MEGLGGRLLSYMEISNISAAGAYHGNAVSRVVREEVRPASSAVTPVDTQRVRAPAEYVIEGELLRERADFADALGRDVLLLRNQARQDADGGAGNRYVGNALDTYRATSEFAGETSSPGRLDLYV